MKQPILVALGPCDWDADFIRAATERDSGFEVRRRCTDVAELQRTAITEPGATAVVGDALARLTSSEVATLKSGGTPVVGLYEAGDDTAARRLHQIGIDQVVPVGNDSAAAVKQLRELMQAGVARPHLHALEAVGQTSGGPIVVVWGPPGAPGRTSVAVALADECARSGIDTLLIDADSTSPSVAAVLGLCDDIPTIDQAIRRAERGEFTSSHLAASLSRVGSRLRLLAGAQTGTVPLPVWEAAAALADLVVVDAGAEPGAFYALIANAALMSGVGAGEPINLARFVTRWPAQVAAAPECATQVVITRVRRAAVGGDTRTIEAVLAEHGITEARFVPDDRDAYDAAVLTGRTLAEAAPNSPARQALRALAAELPARLGLADHGLRLASG